MSTDINTLLSARDLLIETLKKSIEISKKVELPEKLFPSLSQEQALNKIAKCYKNNNMVLVLGAGVSISQGIPNWTTLLQRLTTRTLEAVDDNDNEKNKVLAQLFDLVFGPNPLIAARYLSVYFDDMEEKKRKKFLFEEAIREALYETYSSTNDSSVIKELVKLCVSSRSHALDSVITYNYDDLLEQSLDLLGIGIPYKSIYTIGINPAKNQLPIFHVHGFLPQKGKITKDNKITLGDDSYHLQYNNIYRWSNLIQLQKFKDSNCLFVGVSLTDPNQRRLLDIAKEQRGNNEIVHFLIKRKYKSDEIESVVSGILKNNKKLLSDKERTNLKLADTVDSLVSIVEKFESNDARSFGIEIIWVDEYAEISSILDKIIRISQN
jgi:hypothetical protein